AWHLFGSVGIPAAQHTYAKLAFDNRYFGLFSFVEQVDKRFLKDHFGANDKGNLYKAYCGDIGCATLEHRTGDGGDDGGAQNTGAYWGAGGHPDRRSHIPLVQNVLKNATFRRYYLDHVEYLLETDFTPEAIDARMRGTGNDALWPRVMQAAYLESATEFGPPF